MKDTSLILMFGKERENPYLKNTQKTFKVKYIITDNGNQYNNEKS